MAGKVVPLTAARGAAAPGTPIETPRSDDELMLLARAGSREAMATLASRHVGPLTSFCAKLTGDPGAAEDIVQEVLLRLWKGRAGWTPRGRVIALLYTTARNLCRNRARDLRRRSRWLLPETAGLEAASAGANAGESDVEAVLARERRRDALRALGELSEAMREAVILRFDLEMSYEAIASIVGASESTVRSRVHYGLLRLRELVKDGEER
jgi:RNA polymerase sigma-70 factor (ECF subfamily)